MTLEATAEPSPPTFDALPLSADVRRAVDELGYVHPTPVQRAVFEPAIRGADLVVQARTGTGKTAAFGLPIMDGIVRRSSPTVQAVVLCPTRELALQVTKELSALSKYRGIQVVAVYGGAPMPRQVQAIRAGAHVIVGTPGRVLDHLRRGTLSAKAVRLLVLDESDEMLSMGFLPQITDILGYLPESRQTLLFSATLPSDIQRMAESRLRKPEFVTLSGDQVGALEIQHFVYLCRGDKASALLRILEVENPESAIVFCNTRDETKRVSAALQQQGYDAEWLNADLSQHEREELMDRTRKGELRFLVATDVAARGIDISHLTHVINYDFPETAEQYVHRTGRTGRAGRTGTAIALVEGSDIGNLYYLRLTYKIHPIEKRLPSAEDLKTRSETDIVQMFADLFAAKQMHPGDLALARRLLTHDDAEKIVAGLLRDHLGAIADASEQASASRRARAPTPVTPPSRAQRGQRPGAPVGQSARSAAPANEPVGQSARSAAPANEPDEGRREQARSSGPRRPRPAPEPSPRAPAAEEHHAEPPRPPPGGAVSDEQISAEAPGTVAEIYVNVGRKDGAKASDFYEVLLERGGVSVDETAYVNVRQKHCFIGVQRDHLERALNALNGATIAGRQASAEPSRSRPA